MSIATLPAGLFRRSPWTIFFWAVGLCLLAIAFRYLVIELRPVALMCEVVSPPWWCTVRQFIIDLFYSDAIGSSSLAVAVLSFVLYRQRGSRFLATIAVLIGAPAIALYSADVAVPGFLIGLLRLMRD
ncbi:MAG TPA: hypothetical protein VGO34_08125 [Alphaproteobacteria bacterium]|jgi:hypothetical protein